MALLQLNGNNLRWCSFLKEKEKERENSENVGGEGVWNISQYHAADYGCC